MVIPILGGSENGPRVPHHEKVPLSPEQSRKLVSASETHRLGALYAVAVTLGLAIEVDHTGFLVEAVVFFEPRFLVRGD